MTKLMIRDEALSLKLWQRELVLRERGLKPVEPQYCIVWEDPDDLDAPLKITTPSPMWLAMAMHGNVLPPVTVYPLAVDNKGRVIEGCDLHSDVIPAMSEELAMEYLLQKKIPATVWADDSGNKPRFKICLRTMIPTNRYLRDAWRLAA